MKSKSLSLLCIVSLALAACGDDNGTEPPAPMLANVRVVHASAGAPDLRIRVDEDALGGAIIFGEATPFQKVAATGTLEARHFIVGTTLLSAGLNLTPDSSFTLLVTGLATAMTLTTVADTGGVPAPGTAKIRVIHSALSAPDVEVWLKQPGRAEPFRLLFPFEFRTVSQYQQGDPGDYLVTIRLADTSAAELVSTDTLGLTPGDVRTVVLLDGETGGLQFAVFNDPTPLTSLARSGRQ